MVVVVVVVVCMYVYVCVITFFTTSGTVFETNAGVTVAGQWDHLVGWGCHKMC